MWTSAGDKVVRSKSQEQDQCCQASQGSSLCPVVKWVCLLNHSGNSDQMRYRPDAITVALPLPVVRERSVPCLSEFYSVCVATSCSQVKQKFTITSKFLHFRVTFRINHQGNLKKKRDAFIWVWSRIQYIISCHWHTLVPISVACLILLHFLARLFGWLSSSFISL